MKKYLIGIREEVVARIRAGESQCALSWEYGISRYSIQSRLKESVLPKTRGRKPAKYRRSTSVRTNGSSWKTGYCGIFCVSQEARPRAKYTAIYRHRNEYSVSVICRFF